MPKQPVINGLREAKKKRLTRRELFLAEMDAMVLRGQFQGLIAPNYPKVGLKGARPPMALEVM